MRLYTRFLTICLIFISTFSQAQNSFLKIRIQDESNLNLPGANLTLEPGDISGTTNQNGELNITKLNPGTYRLKVTYTGFTDLDKEITVVEGNNNIDVQLTSGIALDKEVVIVGDRLLGQSKGLNQQKANSNIGNVIYADQVGRFPDANIGDAIKRIPGVTMQNDQGEARNIVIRGMGPELNSVSLNGERIPSAEGDNRRVQMDLVPSDMIQSVEVNKTLTAEMDADAIGGSVNLVSRAPSNGLRLSGTLAGGYNPIRKSYIGTTNLVIGNRFFGKKLGVLLSGSYNVNDYGSDNIESVWERDENGKLYIADHDLRKYDVKRTRRAVSAGLDYKINAKNTIYLTGTYNWRDDQENRFRLRHRLRGDDEDLIYGTDGEITGYTNGEVIRQSKGGIDNDRNDARRLEDQRVRSLAVRGEHFLGKVLLDWSGQYAKASEVRPNERYISMGRRGIEVGQDISDARFPNLTDATSFQDYTRLDELTEQFQDQYEEDLNGKLNVTIPLNWIQAQKGSLKVGARIRTKTKERKNTFFSYEPVNGNETNFENISQLTLKDQSLDKFYPGEKYKIGEFIDPKFLGGLNFNNTDQYESSDEPAEYLAGNYKANEDIYAGYVQLSQAITNKFSFVAGLRTEITKVNYTGNIVENEEDLTGTSTFKNDYSDILPSLNLRYDVNKSTVLRGAVTTALARPKYHDLVPYFNVNPNDFELSSGNPQLKPIRSTNIDLLGEKYFRTIGILSGGIFYKKLSNFFYTYRDENYNAEKFSADFPNVSNPINADEKWEFTQRRNGSDVDVYGFEVAFQRQLDFLPGIWKGFGVYTNYTFTASNAKGIYDGSGVLIREDVTLPGTAPHMFNASLSFENKKTVVRVSANYTAAYVDDSDDAGYNEDAFYDRYYDKQFFLDVNASYAVLKNLRVFAEANNLTNQPLRYYQGEKDRTAQLEYYGPRFNLGVKFDLNR